MLYFFEEKFNIFKTNHQLIVGIDLFVVFSKIGKESFLNRENRENSLILIRIQIKF